MAESATGAEIRQVVEEVLRPRHFFVGPGAVLEWTAPAVEAVPWEIFQGRLLDGTQTRQRRSFLAWNLFWTDEAGRSAEPILSLKLDTAAGLLLVVRALHCHAWEAYDAGNNVILSRETTRWVRELVGSIELARFPRQYALRRELSGLVFQAVVGMSRLPLTSVESPLPAFSLGRLAYFHRPEQPGAAGEGERTPLRSWRDLLTRVLTADASRTEQARLLEFTLRATPTREVGAAASLFLDCWQRLGRPPGEIPALLRTLFNEVSLSPYTLLVSDALAFVQHLTDHGALSSEDQADFLAYLLRQLGRHLAAYDLVTFHHRGANYPDALLLDATLKRLLALADRRPDLFAPAAQESDAQQRRKQLRRRGLRQGWVLRRRYEGHPVPDEPTSPGENTRVLPAWFPRVPEEQITQPGKRRKRLFHDDPLEPLLGAAARAVLRQSVQDLHDPAELRELGTAVFIDRPLGVFKAPAEPDRTVLLSHEAFSRSVAEERLAQLAREPELLPEWEQRHHRETLREGPQVRGLPTSAVRCEERRVVSLADVRRAADDFVLLRTTRQAVREFLDDYDLAALGRRFDLEYLTAGGPVLIVPEPSPPGAAERVLAVYDAQLRKRLELGFTRSQGYLVRRGREMPAGGLQVLRVWETDGENGLRECDLRAEALTVGTIP